MKIKHGGDAVQRKKKIMQPSKQGSQFWETTVPFHHSDFPE